MPKTDLFHHVIDAEIVKKNCVRGKIPLMGTLSEDSIYQENGYYPEVIINHTPTDIQKRSHVTYTVDEDTQTVVKEYHIVDKTADELISAKVSAVNKEADLRVNLISSPEDTLKLFAKAIRVLRKESKGTASQSDVDMLDALEEKSIAAEAVRDAEESIILEVEALSDLQTLYDYPVSDNSNWPG